MSKHWKPDEDLARRVTPGQRNAWPEGATVGLLLVAATCLSVAAILYRAVGPSDIFAP